MGDSVIRYATMVGTYSSMIGGSQVRKQPGARSHSPSGRGARRLRCSAGQYGASHVAYHAKVMAGRGVLRLVDTEQVRRATRHLYALASESDRP